MQYQSGSWYLPWGIPLQKILTMPYPHPGSSTAVTISPFATTNNAPLTCHVLPNQHSSDMNNNSTVAIQGQAAATAGAHIYKHPNIHPNVVGALTFNNASTNLQHSTSSFVSAQTAQQIAPSMPPTNLLNGHGHCVQHFQGAQIQNSHNQHTSALLPTAATLFSPLALRSYLSSNAAINSTLVGVASQATLSDGTQQTPNGVKTTAPKLTLNSSHIYSSQKALTTAINLNADIIAMRHHVKDMDADNNNSISLKKVREFTSTSGA